MKLRGVSSVLVAAAVGAALVTVAASPRPAGAASVSQQLSCSPGGSQSVGLITSAPATVTQNGTFAVSLAPSGSGTADGAEIKNMVTTFQAPAGSEIVAGSAVASGGSGTLGSITTSISGQTVSIKTSGPIANGASFTPPTLTFSLKATGAAGTILKTTFRQSAAYTLTVAGSINVSCNASTPLTTLTSTTISAITTTTTTTAPTSTTTTAPNPCIADRVPFATVSALVARQYRDFTGLPPSAADATRWEQAITYCTSTADDLIVGLLPADLTKIDARLVRLYLAFFGRPPDPDGYAHWQARLAAGWGLVNAARSFADSSEFKRTYGPLGNADFIALVYRNVLGRSPDPGGLAYWLKRLDAKTKSRGDLMVNFSESSENIRSKANHVQVFRMFRSMVTRFPSASEYAGLLSPITGQGRPLTSAAATIRHSSAYGDRF